MRQNSRIPDHSPAALEEALQAALLNLAFKQMEQEELAMMRERIHEVSRDPQRTRFAQRLGSQLRRKRAKKLIRQTLPKVAQAVACLIAALSIGAGVALATSQDVRSWAAGMLTGAVLEDDFNSGVKITATITDGAYLDGRLLLVEDGEALLLRDSTDAEPMRCEWRDRGERRMTQLVEDGGELYAVYRFLYGEAPQHAANGYGLGRVTLNADGSFSVEELAKINETNLAPAESGATYDIRDAVAAGGKLYFAASADVSPEGYFGDIEFCICVCDLSSGAVTRLGLPPARNALSGFGDDCHLFAGESAYAVTVPGEGRAEIFRIEADGSFTKLAEFPEGERPNSFARSAATDTLYYQQGTAIYAAHRFDVAHPERVALSGGNSGRGLLLGESSYAIVGGNAEIFSLDDKPAAVDELTVGGALDTNLDAETRAANPHLTLVGDPAYSDHEWKDYPRKLISAEATADLARIFCFEDGMLRRAGWGKPIADEALCAEIDRMSEGLRRYVTKDGAYIGFPSDMISVFCDISIDPRLWAATGRSEQDMPETWMELLQTLEALSHSTDADRHLIFAGGEDAAQLLAVKLADGFARGWAAQGVEPDFGGADFREALDVLRSIDFGALRCATMDDWNERESILIDLVGESLEPGYNFEWSHWITLKIRPEDAKFSRGTCYIERINPAINAEEDAYAYMRALHLNGQAIHERLRYDFTTPSGELAELGKPYNAALTAADIELYREQVGDIWLDSLSEDAQDRRSALLTAYFEGATDFPTLAEALNAIYAG